MTFPVQSLLRLCASGGLVGGPFGSNLGSSDYTTTGTPVVRGANLGSRFVDGNFVFVSDAKRNELKRNLAVPGDLVFTQRGTLGQVSLVPHDQYAEYVISQSQMRMRVNTSIADVGFVYYACKTPEFRRSVEDHAIRTGVPHINLGILAKLPIPTPGIRDQVGIASVLEALDDKIAANAAAARTAGELSRVRFHAIPRKTGTPLIEVAKFVNGKAFTNGASGTGRVIIRIAELNSGLGGSTVYNDIDVADDHLARPGDLLFAWSGSLTVHRWYRPEAIINQHIFKVIPRDGYPMWLVHQALLSRLEEFKAIAADKATTMGHIQRRHLEEPVAIPSVEHVATETDLMDGLWRTALSAEKENLTLAELRDTLLPALMSGRLKVKDAERQVEDAV